MNFERGGQVHPQLDAVRAPAGAQERLGGNLVVEDARAGGHPLRVALADDPAAAVGVVVRDHAVDDVGDGLEPAVRVPRRADGLVRRVLDRAELVEQEERVGDVRVDATRERAPDLEARAFDRVVRGNHLGHRPGARVSDGAARRGRTSGLSTVIAGIRA